MIRKIFAVGLLVSLLVPSLVFAQNNPGGGGRRNNPKNRLGGLMRGIGELEKGTKAPLTKAQARSVLVLVRPWQKKSTMNADQAKALFGKVNQVLTTPQKNELDKIAALRRREAMGGGGGGAPGGGMMGPGSTPPDPQRMQKIRTFMQTVNPLYPPTSYKEFNDMPERMQQSTKRRYRAFLATMAALAKKAGV